MSRSRGYVRAVVAAAVLGWSVLVAGLMPAAPPASAAPAPKVARVQLLHQTPWVEGHGSFDLEVQATATRPLTDGVRVSVFNRLVTRSDFQEAAEGHVPAVPFYSESAPLASLPGGVDGGVDVALSVDTTAPRGSPFKEVPIGETGVFPVQVSVVGAGGAVEGSPITTFLVFASGSAQAAGYKPLSVAAVVPYSSGVNVSSAGQVEAPIPTESRRLSDVATALNDDGGVPATVLASPLTVSTLATSSAALDRATAATLRQVPNGGLVQVLPATYSPASLGGLVAARLSGEVDHQIAAGSTALTSGFGTAPASGLWVDNGALNSATLAALVGHGIRQLVVQEADLAPLPDYDTQTTFASPTSLKSGHTAVTVMAADEGITNDFTRSEPPVLAANVLLAELAMIQTEEPGISDRGVAAVPPAGWAPSPQFVSTLLGGLEGNPLLSATTVSGLFKAVGHPSISRVLASPSGTGGNSGPGAGGTGALGQSPTTAAGAQTGPTVAPGFPLSALASTITDARNGLNALDVLLPAQRNENAVYARNLLVAESGLLDQPTRLTLLDGIQTAVDKVRTQIRLPGSTSITLTATRGKLPLTILNDAPGQPRVQLELTSQRLIFHSFDPPGGTCTVAPSLTTEICRIRLTHQNTTLNIPVETRSSGVFPLNVSLYSAGGGLLLANNQDTVRSTVVSQVAIALMVLALLSVAIWWFRDLRKGRRPSTLAPSPENDEDDDVSDGADPGPPVTAEQVSPLDPSRGPT